MEEHSTPPPSIPTSIEASAARSAEALRALREESGQAIESQRQRVDDIQQRMSKQLDVISEAIATHDSERESTNIEANAVERDRLQKELVEAQESWQREREEFESQIEQREQEIAARTEELNARQREIDVQSNQMAEEGEKIGSFTLEIEQREIALNCQEDQLTTRQHDSDQRSKALDNREAEIAERESRAEELEAANEQKVAELARQESELSHERQQLQELSEQQSDSESESTQFRKENDELSEQCKKLKSTNDKLQAKLQTRKSQMKEALTQLEQSFLEKESVFQEDLAARTAECEKLTKALRASADQLETSGEAARERNEIQQKFVLALADVQMLREKTASLEQDLASRPDPQQSESADLIHLRAERDALVERVTELESKEPEPADDQARQEMANLQRRFELAVEDVRALKTENAELAQKLEQATTASSGEDDGRDAEEGQDWESQKRRLMAQLEGDDLEKQSGGSPERKKELASIQDTIRITDQVVAEKDRELEELQLQLSEAGYNATSKENPAIAEAIDADEVIQGQRERMAKLEEELQQKLRETELDLSVQRAKIAREQCELAEWRMELECLKGEIDASTPDSQGKTQSKHRWLSKLGLSGDEE